MIQAKVFSHDNPFHLETALNKWLLENKGIEILHTTQSQTIEGGRETMVLVLTVFYKKARR
jgi:hypothetical protein